MISEEDKKLIKDLLNIVEGKYSRQVFFDRVDKYVFDEMEEEYYVLSDEAVADIEKARQEIAEGNCIEFDIEEFKEKLDE